MSEVFVDTAAFIALLNQRDHLYQPARQILQDLRQQKASLVTTEFVLIEVADGLCTVPLRKQVVNFIDSLRTFPILEIIPLSQTLLEQGLLLYIAVLNHL